jgi:hypothetical protein
MCHFITLIAPTADQEALRAVMERYDRAAVPIENESIARMLRPGEFQYLTTRRHCDCGSALTPSSHLGADPPDKLETEIARMARKGWSEAKIARAIHDRRKAEDRPSRQGPDSIELWAALVNALFGELDLLYLGLFIRLYSGNIATESFNATRREVRRNQPLDQALRNLEPDEVTIFRRA